MSQLVGREVTDYSKRIAGDAGNHRRGAQFDVTDGYVGITAFEGRTVDARVLLSPKQMQALVAFIAEAKAHRRSVR